MQKIEAKIGTACTVCGTPVKEIKSLLKHALEHKKEMAK